MNRYKVSPWHGEIGTIWSVIDSKRDRLMGQYSTMRDGIFGAGLAATQCAALNRKTLADAEVEE